MKLNLLTTTVDPGVAGSHCCSPMDPTWPHESAPGSVRSPTRRKMRSKSGAGAGRSKDPVLELMMGERQSTSNSGAAPKQLPVSDVLHTHHQPYSASVGPGASTPAAQRGCCCRLWEKRWFKVLVLALSVAAVVLAIALPVSLSRAAAAARRRMQPPQQGLGPRLDTSSMSLVWADDFTSFDSAVWNFDLGDGSDYGLQSWGNNELQCYTSSSNNVDVIPHPEYPDDDGVLRIRPVYADTPQPCANRKGPNSTRQWTSAKIDTKGKVAFSWAGQQVYRGAFAGRTSSSSSGSTPPTSGHRRALMAGGEAAAAAAPGTNNSTCGSLLVESRMKLPVAAGRWSALWMMPLPQPCPQDSSSPLGECGAYGPWPKSGEIDIIEQVNTDAEVLGTIHYAAKAGFHQYLGGKLPLSQAALLDWNIFQLAWNCSSITWYVNSMQIYQVTKPQLGDAVWPFDEPFFLILNTAVGGWLTGNVAPDKAASGSFMVDYVRVYARPGSA